MGNITAKDVGNFQSGVGKASADINLVGAYIFGGILFILAIVFTVLALVPSSDADFSSNKSCSLGCDNDEKCDTSTNRCKKADTGKKRHWAFLIGTLLCLVIGIGVIMLSRVTSSAVHKNRAFAETYGTYSEAQLLNNI